MTCVQCGAQVAPESRFCNICGAGVEPSVPAPTRSAALEGSGAGAPERTLFSLRPTFLFVGLQYTVAAVVWLVTTALVAWIAAYFEAPWWVGVAIVLLCGLALFVKPALAHLRRQRYLYTLTTHKLEIQYGLLTTTVRNIPLPKIQDVTVSTSLVERVLGLGNIEIDNASESEGRISIRGVRNAKQYADTLLKEMQRWN